MSKLTRSECGKLGAKKAFQNRIDRYTENPNYCQCCNKSLTYKQRHNKYCSRSCAVSVNNLGILRNMNGGTKASTVPIIQICEYCSVEIEIEPRRKWIIRKYCSHECCAKKNWELRKISIEAGKEKSDRCVKRYLVETRGAKCEICGIKEWCGKPVSLIMDHINGHGYDNNLTNVRLICGNCDMQLPTFAGRNRGNGRPDRRERYKRGVSFKNLNS